MKISVYSLSLKDKTPEDVVSLAKEYSCDGIEWCCRENGHINSDSLIDSSKKIAGLMKLSALNTAGLAPYFTFDETKEQVSLVCSAAEIIGAPHIRCHSYTFEEGDSAYGLMDKQRKWLEETVLPVLDKFGLKLAIEQHHNQICPTPDACRKLVDGLPVERLGIIYDPGNSLFEGYTRPEYALDVFGEYISHVHVKNAKPVPCGGKLPPARKHRMLWGAVSEGDIDWERTVKLLHKHRYSGYLSLESLDDRASEQKMAEDIPYLANILEGLSRKK